MDKEVIDIIENSFENIETSTLILMMILFLQ